MKSIMNIQIANIIPIFTLNENITGIDDLEKLYDAMLLYWLFHHQSFVKMMEKLAENNISRLCNYNNHKRY